MTSFALKLAAIIAMTLDHVASFIGQRGLMNLFSLDTHTSYVLMQWLHGIGRMAFPLFVFLLVEGTRKTRSMPRYIGRLALFALISEPFFYFAHWQYSPTLSGFFRDVGRLSFGNVFFTLTLGALMIYAFQKMEGKKGKYTLLWEFLLLGAAAFVAQYIGCDYGMYGVALIGLMYLAGTKGRQCVVILVWSVIVYVLTQLYNPLWSGLRQCLFASASCLLIWLYNGKRGRPMKWSFYVYYPAHLLVLTLIHYAAAG